MEPTLHEQIDELLTWFEIEAPELAAVFRHIRTLPLPEQKQCLAKLDERLCMYRAAETRRAGMRVCPQG
jgi:hypothetical protein